MPTTAELLSNTTDFWLEFSANDWTAALQYSQALSPPGIARQVARTYLASLLLQPLLSEETGTTATRWPDRSMESAKALWSLVNGCAFVTPDLKLVAIATDGINSPFAVPQEWVDIPDWVADYYVHVQVDSEEQIARIARYCTHSDLKTVGEYDSFDRTYRLAGDHFTDDIYTLFLLNDSGLAGVTQVDVNPLPEMTAAQRSSLLAQLSDPEIPFPRLERPFVMWGACLGDRQWRQQLYEHRQGLVSSLSTRVVNLAAWVRGVADTVIEGWQPVLDSGELAFRDAEVGTQQKSIRVGENDYFLSLNVVIQPDGTIDITASVMPSSGDRLLPADFRLDLCNVNGEVLAPSPEVTGNDYRISQEFSVESGDQFMLRVSAEGDRHEEYFEFS